MSDAFNPLKANKRVLASGLRSLERLVAVALISFWSEEHPQPWPSVETLQKLTGMSRRAVFDALAALRAAGAIVVSPNYPDSKSNRYDLSGMMSLPPQDTHRCIQRTDAPCARMHVAHQNGAPPAPGTVHLLHPNVSSEVTKEVIKPREPAATPKAVRKQRSEQGRVAKWRRVPEAWEPSAAHRNLARECGVNIDAELAKFRDHEFAKPRSDADAAFRNWLRSAQTFGGARHGKPTVQRGGVIRESDSRWLDDAEGAAE